MKDVDYYIGFTTDSTVGAADLFAEPIAPASYKRADAIAEYKRDQLEKFLATAHEYPFSATLTGFCLLDDEGHIVTAARADEPGVVSAKLVRALTVSSFGVGPFERYPAAAGETFTPSRRLWGLDVDRCLRVAAVEALKTSPGLDVPLRLWYQNSGARDPFDVLAGATERRIFRLEGVAAYFGLTPPPPNDARLMADFARRLVGRAQLTRPS